MMINRKKLVFIALVTIPLWASFLCSCGGNSAPTTPVQLPTTVEYISRGYEPGDVLIAGSLNACIMANGETVTTARGTNIQGFAYESDVDEDCRFCIAAPAGSNYLVNFSTATANVANFAVSELDLKIVPATNLTGAVSAGVTECVDSVETDAISIVDLGTVTIDEANATADTGLTASEFSEQVNMPATDLLGMVDEWFVARSPAGGDGDGNGCLDYQASYDGIVPTMISTDLSLADCAASERLRTRGNDNFYSALDGDNSTDDDTFTAEAFIPVHQINDARVYVSIISIFQSYGLLSTTAEEEAIAEKFLDRDDHKYHSLEISYLYYYDPGGDGLDANNALNESLDWLIENSGSFMDASLIEYQGYSMKYYSNHIFDPVNFVNDDCASVVESETYSCDTTLYMVSSVEEIPLVTGDPHRAWAPFASDSFNTGNYEYSFFNPSNTYNGSSVPPAGDYYIVTEESAQNTPSADDLNSEPPAYPRIKFTVGQVPEYSVESVAIPLIKFNVSDGVLQSIDYKWIKNGDGDQIISDCNFKNYMYMLNGQVYGAAISLKKTGNVSWLSEERLLNDPLNTDYYSAGYNPEECAKTLDCTLDANGNYAGDRTCWGSGTLDLTATGKTVSTSQIQNIDMAYTDSSYNQRKLGEIR